MKESICQTLFLFHFFRSSWGGFTPDWPSLDSRPLPDWYDQAKIGIFMHFGVYSVPAFSDAWFWSNLHNNESSHVEFMKNNYPPKFTYQDFGSSLSMEFFNATWMADLIKSSGAKYLVFTSKHHDGFTNWPSSYTFGWNSMDIGPKRDVLAELKSALEVTKSGVKFGLYYSLFEWFHPLYMKDKANNYTTREFVLNKMLPEMKELVEIYQPAVLWSDGDWEADADYFGSRDFLAWLYNESPVKDLIVTNDRWGRGCQKTHGGFWSGPDRWSPGVLINHKWENAMIVDQKSWGNRKNLVLQDIIEPKELISLLASTVSCGGNILINVGPTKEGTIIPIFEERLRQLGSWLEVNGEAIYGSKPWVYQNDTLSVENPVWFTSGNGFVYALVIGWPKDETLVLGSVRSKPGVTRIQMLGLDPSLFLDFRQGQLGLEIKFPSMSKLDNSFRSGSQWVYTLKMEGILPVPKHLKVRIDLV